MEDGLPGAGTDVEDGAVSLLNLAMACNLGRGKMAAADDFGVSGLGLFQSRKMFLGYDQDVRWGLRLDVFESQDVIVLVNFCCGNFAAEDAAEQAVGGWVGHE